MISHDYRCVFVHIPRTGGQSIESEFLELLGPRRDARASLLLAGNRDPSKGPPRLAHLTAQEYVKHGYMSNDLFHTYFKFSFVRNPWDRLVSEYRFAHADHSDFKTFVLKRFPAPSDDHFDTAVDHYRHVLPQHAFLCDEAGTLLVDFVGRYEKLQEDFALVAQRVGISPITLRHRNRSAPDRRYKRLVRRLLRTLGLPDRYYKRRLTRLLNRLGVPVSELSLERRRRPYAEYYDDETREFVATFYARDIALFNYRCGE